MKKIAQRDCIVSMTALVSGMDIALTSLDQAATRLRYDYDRYGKLIKAAGIKAE